MLKVNSYSGKATKLTDVTLPKEWEAKANLPLLAQAIHVYRDRSHIGLAKAKTRGEVNRTTKKLYKQKGTGGARHGSKGAPIFVGGGVAHGPKPFNRELTLPEKMKKRALFTALSLKAKDKKIIVADVSFKKTKEASNFIKKIFKGEFRITFVLKKSDMANAKALRNIKNTSVKAMEDLNAYDVFLGGNLVFDKGIFAKTETKKETEK